MTHQGGPPQPPTTGITAGEQRIELQLEGFRSVVSGGFLTMAKAFARVERLLETAAEARAALLVETRKTNTLLREQLDRMPQHTNGSIDVEITEEHEHG